jgi:hypothetical protein
MSHDASVLIYLLGDPVFSHPCARHFKHSRIIIMDMGSNMPSANATHRNIGVAPDLKAVAPVRTPAEPHLVRSGA